MAEEFQQRLSKLGEAMQNADALPPEQPSLEGHVTRIFGKPEPPMPKAVDADLNWNDPVENAIQAWLTQAWLSEVYRKRGTGALILPEDIACLRQAQAALRLIPR